jgi:phytoene dehydrogenase-like protein
MSTLPRHAVSISLHATGRLRLPSGKAECNRPRLRDSEFSRAKLPRECAWYSWWSPFDLEEKLGLVGEDIFHGALGLGQLWAARPVLGYGDYRTPLKSLYLCSSGAHPGGGVTGIPGRNAAREIFRDGFRRAQLC